MSQDPGTTSGTREPVPAPSRATRLLTPYIAAVCIGGMVITLRALFSLQAAIILPLEVACVAAGAAEAFRVTVGSRTINVSASIGVALAALVALGPAAAIVTVVAGGFGLAFFPRIRPLNRTAFNLGLFGISAGVAGVADSAVSAVLPAVLPAVAVPAAAAVVWLAVYFAVNWPLLVTVVWLSSGRAPVITWREDLRWLPVPIAVAGALGIVLGMNYLHFGWAGTVLWVLPLAGLRQTLRLEAMRHVLSPRARRGLE